MEDLKAETLKYTQLLNDLYRKIDFNQIGLSLAFNAAVVNRLKMMILEPDPGPQLTEETKRRLAQIGYRILGYNCQSFR